MSRIGINIDPAYKRASPGTQTLRARLTAKVHPPHKRATSKTLLWTGLATLVIAAGLLLISCC